MGTCYSFISTEKIKDNGTFTRKMKHNYRLGGHIPNADPMRSYLNEELIPLKPGTDYIDAYNQRVTSSKYYKTHAIRKDAVRGIELMMTYSGKNVPEDFDRERWKKDNIEWLQEYFGKENVVSAILHLDETTPHIHAVVIPMVNDRLNARNYLGGRQKLRELQNDYAQKMEHLGLSRGIKGSPAKHTDIRDFYTALNQAKEKELPKPQKHEKAMDYYERARECFQTANYQHLGELKDKEREIVELNAGTLDKQLELNRQMAEQERLLANFNRKFGKDKKEVLKKIHTMNLINDGLKAYPDKEFSKEVFSGMREIMRFAKEQDLRNPEREETLDEMLEHFTNKRARD